MQKALEELCEYSSNHDMKLNEKKTKVILFNTSRNLDFHPKLATKDMDCGEFLEVVDKAKLLGVFLRSDMKWFDNTDYICSKGYHRLWLLRRLKSLGAENHEILDVFMKRIRIVLELAVPVWNPGLTVGLSLIHI